MEGRVKLTKVDSKFLMLLGANPTLEQRLGQVAVHEGTHSSNKNAMSIFVGDDAAEETAVNKEIESIRQTNIERIPTPKNIFD